MKMTSTDGPRSSGQDTASEPCIRCKSQPAAHDLRSENVCTPCFVQYIQNKAIKRLELLQRETRGLKLPSKPQRYLLALSGGPSSTCLLDVLYDNILQQRARGQRVKFELLVAHIVDDGDTVSSVSGGNGVVDKFRERFPEVEIQSIPLSAVLALDSIDWSALPPTDLPAATQEPEKNNGHRHRLAYLFSQLPSATSRADVRRLLTRHLLITTAVQNACDVLLLGYNTTSLAELTLSETAKGRGFALPWMVNDGVLPLPRSMLDRAPEPGVSEKEDTGGSGKKDSGRSSNPSTTGIPIYSPLRDIYRKELFVYLTTVSTSTSAAAPASVPAATSTDTTAPAKAPLFSIIPPHLLPSQLQKVALAAATGTEPGQQQQPPPAVVSHRDLSIDDVMARYFAEVEANYPSVVANVVRTTGKLSWLLSGDVGHDHDHDHPTQDADDSSSPTTTTTTTTTTTDAQPRERGRCGICGLQLDEHGNQRWRGEIGDFDAKNNEDGPAPTPQQQQRQKIRQEGRLCYGCERSILG
ncbi:uncharacterized protein B0I36DRAFT_315068 [Microdochium trichocladiopsis]|uniref:Cytoplasmic tRNA 2-thiolation protein 2 n=1 Tax=Microdochium trichocladiopsis TaxID=1682393 RepID=A0A9P8YFF6_9PEZI|nr:uncharacterized protein B0I36DRAFT_315068 [Microdochium trichocladiopsis]KAH7037922.1 hypothetical protein B0I36DRAFT_315068 [Microdochium trichocladiopsis]